MALQRIPRAQRQFAKRLRSAQTLLEADLWRELRAKRLDGWKFKRQAPIGPYIVDFVCFERRLIVEADGPLHADPEQQLYDRDATRSCRMPGFESFGSVRKALGNSARVFVDIRQALGPRPLPTPD